MAYTTVAKPSLHFTTDIYAGSSSAKTITGIGFKPDFVITKDRTEAHAWGLYDSNRGIKRWLKSSSAQSENNNAGASVVDASLTAFTSDGFTIATMSSDPIGNKNGNEFNTHMWKANGGTTSTDSNGSINSTVQANTTAGFSIVTYTGTGSAATIGHGLGVKPKMIWIKNRSAGDNWTVYFGDTNIVADPETDYFELNALSGTQDATYFNDTAPTTSVFSIGTDHRVNASSENYVAYCWSEIQGFSKMGIYIGNGVATRGNVVYCGFRPRYILVKRQDGNETWHNQDVSRSTREKDGSAGTGGNPRQQRLSYNAGDAESSSNGTCDFFATGFRFQANDARYNSENVKYLFYAVAEASIVGTNGTVALSK